MSIEIFERSTYLVMEFTSNVDSILTQFRHMINVRSLNIILLQNELRETQFVDNCDRNEFVSLFPNATGFQSASGLCLPNNYRLIVSIKTMLHG